MIDKIFNKRYIVLCTRNNVVLNSFLTISDCDSYIKTISSLFNIPYDSMYIMERSDYVSK